MSAISYLDFLGKISLEDKKKQLLDIFRGKKLK